MHMKNKYVKNIDCCGLLFIPAGINPETIQLTQNQKINEKVLICSRYRRFCRL